MQLQIDMAVGLLSLLLVDGAKGHVPIVSNYTQTPTAFEPVCSPTIVHRSVPNLV